MYRQIRLDVPDHRGAAMHRAAQIWNTERRLHLDPELAVNHAFNHVTWPATRPR
ncbi:hypothetical protein [Actinacidiphila bryophytorum]|uniref:hypothetical protein n=1 Tax=Actinacidiphila bryophytorum TaxID=1436133 RepID=UPI00195F78BE|nr:hypothetical protein [Actinacidiphila bryophytorum]MBM9435339.1 hypothetical protein [Actinacidiphila bryophytorum]MBN6542174.1 hypothetical protein [Actinacidiphila bryophytorum]